MIDKNIITNFNILFNKKSQKYLKSRSHQRKTAEAIGRALQLF